MFDESFEPGFVEHKPRLESTDLSTSTCKRLLFEQRTYPAPGQNVVRHLCGLRWCREHLAWGTIRENSLDRVFHDLYGHGNVAPRAYEEGSSFGTILNTAIVDVSGASVQDFLRAFRSAVKKPRAGSRTARLFVAYFLPENETDELTFGPPFKEVLQAYKLLLDRQCGVRLDNAYGAMYNVLRPYMDMPEGRNKVLHVVGRDWRPRITENGWSSIIDAAASA